MLLQVAPSPLLGLDLRQFPLAADFSSAPRRASDQATPRLFVALLLLSRLSHGAQFVAARVLLRLAVAATHALLLSA